MRRMGERGAAAVEAALVTPVVFAMLFGIIEMGFFFKDWLATSASTRAAVRLASANPRTLTFAQDAADEVQARGGTALDMTTVKKLWVYKAQPGEEYPVGGDANFSACTYCVKFAWNGTKFVSTSDTWSGTLQNACTPGLGGPPDRLGVYMQVEHTGLTKYVFTKMTISEDTVMSLEPIPFLNGCK